MKTVLELEFLDGTGKKFKIRINDPREGLEKISIESTMDIILEKNIFTSNNTDLVSKLSARIIETAIEVMEFN